MKVHILLFILFLLFMMFLTSSAQTASPGKNSFTIRGRSQEIYFYPATGADQNRKILFVPGDGGFRGFAVTMAQEMAAEGYDVYGLDTKNYLESFTGRTNLKEADVMGDFRQLAHWITQDSGERVTLVGWSEGAGLCLLAAASDQNKQIFSGLVSIGISESSVLGWRWIDNLTYVTGKDPDEPTFLSATYLPRVSPLPLFMIQSSNDAFITLEKGQALFALAREPKQFVLVQAQNHRFDGNREEFFRRLNGGLLWISKATR